MKKCISILVLICLCLFLVACDVGLNASQKALKVAFEQQIGETKQEYNEKIQEAKKLKTAIEEAGSLEEQRDLAISAGIVSEEDAFTMTSQAFIVAAEESIDSYKELKDIVIDNLKDSMKEQIELAENNYR